MKKNQLKHIIKETIKIYLKEINGKNSEDFGYGDAWLSPDGKFYETGGDHDGWAYEHGENTIESLLDKGWARVVREELSGRMILHIDANELTERQKTALEVWFHLHPNIERLDESVGIIKEGPDSVSINGRTVHYLDSSNVASVLIICKIKGTVLYFSYIPKDKKIYSSDKHLEKIIDEYVKKNEKWPIYVGQGCTHETVRNIIQNAVNLGPDWDADEIYRYRLRLIHARIFELGGDYVFSCWETLDEVRKNSSILKKALHDGGWDLSRMGFDIADQMETISYDDVFGNIPTDKSSDVKKAEMELKQKLHVNPDLKKAILELPPNRFQKLADKMGMPMIKLKQLLGKEMAEISKGQLKEIIKEIINEEGMPAKYWWLDPDLKFHRVPYMGHNQWAWIYLTKMKNYSPYDPRIKENIYKEMYKLGWVRVSLIGDRGKKVMEMNYDSLYSPPRKQMNAIKELALQEKADEMFDLTKGHREELLQEWEYPTPSENDDRPHEGWWMNPQGELHKVYTTTNPNEGHWIWAAKFIKKTRPELTLKQLMNDVVDPEGELYKLGWIRIAFNYIRDGAMHFTHDDHTLSPKMEKYLKDMAIEIQARKLVDDSTKEDIELLEIRLERPVNDTDDTTDRNVWYNKNNSPQQTNLHKENVVNEEMTYSELIKLTAELPRSEDGTNRIDRSKTVRVRSIPVSIEEGQEQWNFRYKSSPQTGDPGDPYEGHISFLKGEVDRGDDATELECNVDCGCKDYRYRFAWNNYSKKAGVVGPDSKSGCINRRPKPAYDYGNGLCKHLSALSRYLQTKITATKKSNLFEAINDVAKQGPFNISYYD